MKHYFAALAALMPLLGEPALAQNRAGTYVPNASLKDRPSRAPLTSQDTFQHEFCALRAEWLNCFFDEADDPFLCAVTVKPPRAPDGRDDKSSSGAR